MDLLKAHYDRETGRVQSLEEHLIHVAKYAKKQAELIGQGDILFLIGLYHDLGKADRLFQQKLEKNSNLSVDHSYAGARLLYLRIKEMAKRGLISSSKWQTFAEIIAYVISAHHGMYDIPEIKATNASNYGFSKLNKRLLGYEEGYHYKEDVIKFAKILNHVITDNGYESLNDLILKSYDNFQNAWNRLLVNDNTEESFYLGCFVRLYLSLLKNADVLDTVNAYEKLIKPMELSKLQELSKLYCDAIEKKYSSFISDETPLNRIRNSIAKRVKERGKLDSSGIYCLDLPTGAGKTLLSMRYAFHQMKYKGKSKFFYIAPYLSVLEQNAAEIKKVIGEDEVLEHHSNIFNEEEKYQNVYSNYLVDSWDSPVVLTSMVQFFQTLFKTKSANIRRFSSLINAVVILDEVQSLPIEVNSIQNLSFNFLSHVMRANIVLCTATQPVYDSKRLKHPICYGGKENVGKDIVVLQHAERKVFQRTELIKFSEENSISSLWDVAKYVIENDKSILIILNTKGAVDKLYEMLIEKGEKRILYKLSTNMCAQHRSDVIENIKKQMNSGEHVVCISTQLIEAGVDLDFTCVVRSYAGIDSIVQASGRCNREGKQEIGRVVLVNLGIEENIKSLKEIKNKKDVTEYILHQQVSPIDIATLNDHFFERYYAVSQNLMDYPVGDNETVYDYLSQNNYMGAMTAGILKHSFKTAGQKMNLIQEETIGVLVLYGEGKEELNKLEEMLSENTYYDLEKLKEIKNLLKKLQPYSINVREGDELLKAAKSYLNGQILILPKEYYDEQTGVNRSIHSFLL